MTITNYIEGKKALITGATKGIGYECAKLLADYGVNLILVARDEAKLSKVKGELKNKVNVETIALDVRDKESVVNKLKDIDVDILLNDAGLAVGLDPFDECNIDDWEVMIDTNIKGLLYVTRTLIGKMKNKETAHIVNLGSVAGLYAYPKGNIYSATKSSVHSITEGLNSDLLGTNVKATVVAPGAVHTDFSNTRFKGDTQKADAVYVGYTPLTPKDIANCILSALNTPKHVNIQHIDIMPTDQRNPYLLAKS